MAQTLAELLQRLLKDHFGGKKSAMAAAIAMTPSPLGKVIEGTVPYLGVEACLRLAEATGEPASMILRAANKSDIADLIERLYGAQTISSTDRQLIGDWALLDEDEKKAFRMLIHGRVADRKRRVS